MSEIELRNVGVEFPIYDVNTRRLVRTDLLRRRLGGRLGERKQDARVVVTALSDVTLGIPHGARVGLIGHNGAGKTTLLRVLAGIYHPSRGEIRVDGRVSPLFDVTLGMEYDATGYENISILGMLLGLSREDVRRAIPEIEEFTGLRGYLSLPVRTYSAGMQMRLAFAMMTAVTPEIVLLDEAIGSGDAAFRRSMQHRLHQFLSQSSIMVLASHSDDLIRQFCTRGIVLEGGEIVFDGPVEEALASYQRDMSADN
jgi:ABC-2 type transport system ATP-binding protein/lipopolysaccharide transport system ATP-binding protein